MTEKCETTLQGLIHFDESFNQDPSGEQKKRVTTALYVFLSYPLSLPLEKKVYGIANADEFIAKDIQRMYDQDPEKNVNRILFNYILGAVQTVKLIVNEKAPFEAWYNPFDRSITFKSKSPDEKTKFSDAGTLLHESRHSEYFDHEIYCPKLASSMNACDKGTNKSHGWEASFYWALLQGHSKAALSPWELQTIEDLLLMRTRFLYLLPSSWESLKGPVYNPLSYQNLPTPQDVVKLEELPSFERDYYGEVTTVCGRNVGTNALETSYDACDAKIRSILTFDEYATSPEVTRVETAVVDALHLLLLRPMGLPQETNLMTLAATSELLSPDLVRLIEQHPQQSLNALFFNYILNAIQTFKVGDPKNHTLQYRFSDRSLSLPLTVAKQGPMDDWDLVVSLIEKARSSEVWPQSLSSESSQNTVKKELGMQGPYGWSTIYLWSLIKQPDQNFLSSTEAEYLTYSFCHKLTWVDRLPDYFEHLKSQYCFE